MEDKRNTKMFLSLNLKNLWSCYSCLQSELILTIANYRNRRRKMVNEWLGVFTFLFRRHITVLALPYAVKFIKKRWIYKAPADPHIYRNKFTRDYLKNYAQLLLSCVMWTHSFWYKALWNVSVHIIPDRFLQRHENLSGIVGT